MDNFNSAKRMLSLSPGLDCEVSNLDGQRVELFIGRFENGSVEFETRLVNGKKNGWSTVWFENGQIRSRGDYLDDRLNGQLQTWSEDGEFCLEANFQSGVMEGKVSISSIMEINSMEIIYKQDSATSSAEIAKCKM